jgi:hypothetical protein
LVAAPGAPAIERVEMEFKPSGELVYATFENDRWQLMFLSYHIEGNHIVSNQPSAPKEERTLFSIAKDGSLVLDYGDSKSTYKRASTCGPSNPPLNRTREKPRAG